MKAVILRDLTPGHEVRLEETGVARIKPGWVLVKVKAFGLNHSEKILRLSEIRADYIKKPLIPGIECVGEVADPSDSRFERGQKVAAFMGGMGRSFNGSYAEYVLVPTEQVFSIDSELAWARLAAVPETYFTAWGSLFQSLKLSPDDRLLIRGASSALGYAALQLAKAVGCQVVASTHREEKLPLLAAADEVLVDGGHLQGQVNGVNKVLELVGPRTLKDSLKLLEPGGIVCHTGVLGGLYVLDGFDPIKAIPNGVYLTGYFSNYPTQAVMDSIFAFLKTHRLEPCLGEVFDFQAIGKACMAQDSGKVNGKIVVTL